MSAPSSSRSTFLAVGLAFAASAGFVGCQQGEENIEASDYPARMAAGYCKAVFNCPCESYPYTDVNTCFNEIAADYDALNSAAYLAGLAYDGECPARELDFVEALACKASIAPVPGNLCVRPCNVWHGQSPAGSACQVVATSAELGRAFSTCAQGLACVANICVDPCQGGTPLPSIGQPCPDLVCTTGAMCDLETMTCVAEQALPGPGQPCSAEGLCNPLNSVCVPAANTCATLPSTGQACIEFQCDANSTCDVAEEICVARWPLACGLLGAGVPGDGDGDGDTTGDGDGDTTGDGDGDTTGDGDGDTTGGECLPLPLPSDTFTGAGGTTSGGTTQAEGSCGGAGPEIMYSYVVPASGAYLMSTEGSNFDTTLYVREGDCFGAELACDDDNFSPASGLEVFLEAGQEVVIIVDSFGDPGDFVLTVEYIG